MMKYALLVGYDGGNYGGWQFQNNAVTVQQKIEEAVCKVLGYRAAVHASGRTDGGVHAEGQVCCFTAESSVPPEKMADALNFYLPEDISVIKSAAAPDDFDCCRNAKRKTYRYRVYFSPRRIPTLDRYYVNMKGGADIGVLRDICNIFVGEHDFAAYCASGSSAKTTVRTVYSFTVSADVRENYTAVEFYVCGNGFLYNMVRTMVGTALNCAMGVIPRGRVEESLSSPSRNSVGKTMPAKGLTLVSVDYGFPLFG